MYGNNFFNPYMYQPYYQASNLGLGSMSRASSFGSTASNLGGAARGFGTIAGGSGFGNATSNLGGAGIKGLLSKFSFSGFLNGASKTLNVVNQAIPIFYQVKPMINNAKTMFRIMGAVRDDKPVRSSQNRTAQSQLIDNGSNNISSISNTSNNYQDFNEENPTFFI